MGDAVRPPPLTQGASSSLPLIPSLLPSSSSSSSRSLLYFVSAAFLAASLTAAGIDASIIRSITDTEGWLGLSDAW